MQQPEKGGGIRARRQAGEMEEMEETEDGEVRVLPAARPRLTGQSPPRGTRQLPAKTRHPPGQRTGIGNAKRKRRATETATETATEIETGIETANTTRLHLPVDIVLVDIPPRPTRVRRAARNTILHALRGGNNTQLIMPVRPWTSICHQGAHRFSIAHNRRPADLNFI